MNVTRRFFIKLSCSLSLLVGMLPWLRPRVVRAQDVIQGQRTTSGGGIPPSGSHSNTNFRLGVDRDGRSKVYFVKDDTPENNMRAIIDKLGGIEKIVGRNDVVVLKPNAQRHNQGMTNTDAMKGFIDLVLGIEGFAGEIVIAENHQYADDNCCGWSTEFRNGRFNLNELVAYYQDQGINNVTKYHWHVAGPCSYPLEGNGQGNARVNGPQDGDGYVWMEDNYYVSPAGRTCLMTYPVFTSSYSGITIDLKNGLWINGEYLNDRQLKFINFSALNHHGRYCGVTASVKNLMGVVDMTCGFPGDLLPDTYNTHHIGVSRFKHFLYHTHWRITSYKGWLMNVARDYCYRNFHHTGGVLGHFMAHVRMPDLHILAADLVGWGDRRDLKRAFRPQAMLASTDPVALDYVAAKYVLFPGTPAGEKEVAGVLLTELNDPDRKSGPFYKFLKETHNQRIGNINPDNIDIIG